MDNNVDNAIVRQGTIYIMATVMLRKIAAYEIVHVFYRNWKTAGDNRYPGNQDTIVPRDKSET